MLDTVGLAPHTTTSRLDGRSSGSAESMSPKVSAQAWPAVAAQIVWATSGTPSRANRSGVRAWDASTAADEL